MSEAEIITTTSRPRSERPRSQLRSDLERRHFVCVAALMGIKPSRIIGNADRFDVIGRARHLEAFLEAVSIYVKAVVADTTHEISPVCLRDETELLSEAASDIVGAIMNAQDRMQEIAEAEEA